MSTVYWIRLSDEDGYHGSVGGGTVCSDAGTWALVVLGTGEGLYLVASVGGEKRASRTRLLSSSEERSNKKSKTRRLEILIVRLIKFDM